MSEKLKIYTVKTEEKIFISDNPNNNGYNNNTLVKYFFNGKKPEQSFHKDWFFVNEEIIKVTKINPASTKFLKFEIVDNSLICDKLPEFFT